MENEEQLEGQLNIYDYLANPEEPPKKCAYIDECEAHPTGCGGNMDPERCGGPFKWSEKLNTPKAPIYHCSLTHVYEECPTCKEQNKLSVTRCNRYGEFYTEYRPKCPRCGQVLLWDWDEIDQKAKKSKEYIEAERRQSEEGRTKT